MLLATRNSVYITDVRKAKSFIIHNQIRSKIVYAPIILLFKQGSSSKKEEPIISFFNDLKNTRERSTVVAYFKFPTLTKMW